MSRKLHVCLTEELDWHEKRKKDTARRIQDQMESTSKSITAVTTGMMKITWIRLWRWCATSKNCTVFVAEGTAHVNHVHEKEEVEG